MTRRDPLGGDSIGVIFAFNEDKLPIAAILLIQSKNGMGGCATARKGVKDDSVIIVCCRVTDNSLY